MSSYRWGCRTGACGRSSGAIRDGDWKLIEFFDDNTVELYHLAEDPGEKTNLAVTFPERAAGLRQQLEDWRVRIGAGKPATR